MLEENQRLCEEYRRLYCDYLELDVEMQRVKDAVNSRYETYPSNQQQPDGEVSSGRTENDEVSGKANIHTIFMLSF